MELNSAPHWLHASSPCYEEHTIAVYTILLAKFFNYLVTNKYYQNNKKIIKEIYSILFV